MHAGSFLTAGIYSATLVLHDVVMRVHCFPSLRCVQENRHIHQSTQWYGNTAYVNHLNCMSTMCMSVSQQCPYERMSMYRVTHKWRSEIERHTASSSFALANQPASEAALRPRLRSGLQCCRCWRGLTAPSVSAVRGYAASTQACQPATCLHVQHTVACPANVCKPQLSSAPAVPSCASPLQTLRSAAAVSLLPLPRLLPPCPLLHLAGGCFPAAAARSRCRCCSSSRQQ